MCNIASRDHNVMMLFIKRERRVCENCMLCVKNYTNVRIHRLDAMCKIFHTHTHIGERNFFII